ncbi:MAG: FHA domain-containing protein [Timaviella obliquedivisa GSE-PSE-MK23-08B]|jgi:ferredoxin-NADP reductase|nr:FHA domain-containing protein [Timaviella obliquedivisa GSE-PSE-MK23-08B]
MLKLKSVNFNHQLFQDYTLEPADEREWIIGRDPRCQIVLTTLDVSRTHGRISYEDDVYYFENISQHGTTLNSTELLPSERKPLHKGDLLVLGETYLQIEELTALTSLDLASHQPLKMASEWQGDLQVRCCRIIDETADVKTFCFTAEPATLFHYKPGQFVNLEVEIDGKPVVRPYSISSSPTRPHHLAVTIKRLPRLRNDLPPGLVSNWMHDRLQVGDRIKLRGAPMGNFTCLPAPPKILLASAGSGITPMMSMARWVQDTLAPCDIIFLHSARTPEDIIFRRELEVMAAQIPNFRLAFTVSRPSAQSNWTGLTGRISNMMLQMVVPDLSDRAVYVCGSKDWMQNIKSILTALDFPMSSYQEESFGGYRPASASNTTQLKTETGLEDTFIGNKGTTESNGNGHQLSRVAIAQPIAVDTAEISFSQSGVNVLADGELSILELAEQEGISIPNACRAGGCGACKVRTQGRVRYATAPTALTAADREAGHALACVAHPVGSLVVDA